VYRKFSRKYHHLDLNQLPGIKLIAIINGLTALLHIVFWVLAFFKLPAITLLKNSVNQINLATTYGLGISDLLWSVPLLLIGSIGLWKRYQIGWLAAHLANVLYWYSFTVLIIRDLAANSISPGTIIFSPFVLFSFWASYFLWKNRKLFFFKV
jgi:hypothetical protein